MTYNDHQIWILIADEIAKLLGEGKRDDEIKVNLVKLTHGMIEPMDIQREITRQRGLDCE